MLMAQRCVEIARKRGEAKKPLNRVYRMLSDQELYLEAYAKLYSNPGAIWEKANRTQNEHRHERQHLTAIHQAEWADNTVISEQMRAVWQ